MTLDQWLKVNEMTEGEFAERISSSQASVNRYRKGRVPAPPVMVRIFEATKGQVPPSSFYNLPVLMQEAA